MRAEDPKHEFTGQLEMYDSNEIAAYLFDYPEIKTLRITGPGGFAPAAREIADKLIRFEVDTVAFGECNSACSTIFRDAETGSNCCRSCDMLRPKSV